jgi:hypothetical protein
VYVHACVYECVGIRACMCVYFNECVHIHLPDQGLIV